MTDPRGRNTDPVPVNSVAGDGQPQRSGALFMLPLLCFVALVFLSLWGLGFNWFGVFGEVSRRDAREIKSVLIDKTVPEFDLAAVPGLKDKNGAPVSGFGSKDLKGRITLVNVWASWCDDCRAEHGSLLELAKDPSIRLVGMNYKDKPGDALRMLLSQDNPYAAVGMDEKGLVGIDFGVYGVPETFIVDANGRIRDKLIGGIYPHKLDDFRKKIAAVRDAGGDKVSADKAAAAQP